MEQDKTNQKGGKELRKGQETRRYPSCMTSPGNAGARA